MSRLKRLQTHHKIFEAIGLFLALGAWAWDLHVQTIQRNADMYVAQLSHMMNSAQQYAARDRIIAEMSAATVLNDNSGKTVDEIYGQAWKRPSFRERWWEASNTAAMWMSRIHALSLRATDQFGVDLPRTFKEIRRIDNEVHSLLHPPSSKVAGAPEEWMFLDESGAKRVSRLIDEFSEAVMLGTNELYFAMASKKSEARNWHIAVAVLGSILVVIGRAFGWLEDAEKAKLKMLASGTDLRQNTGAGRADTAKRTSPQAAFKPSRREKQ